MQPQLSFLFGIDVNSSVQAKAQAMFPSEYTYRRRQSGRGAFVCHGGDKAPCAVCRLADGRKFIPRLVFHSPSRTKRGGYQISVKSDRLDDRGANTHHSTLLRVHLPEQRLSQPNEKDAEGVGCPTDLSLVSA